MVIRSCSHEVIYVYHHIMKVSSKTVVLQYFYGSMINDFVTVL